MRYSYAWEITPADIAQAKLPEAYNNGEWPYGRRYVCLEGVLRVYNSGDLGNGYSLEGAEFTPTGGQPFLVLLAKRGIPNDERKRWVPGRLWMDVDGRVGLDARVFGYSFNFEVGSARLTGESIAGLVVAAMGVFVFGLYLRSYMAQRKASSIAKQIEATEDGP
jgi:hypothetical protein